MLNGYPATTWMCKGLGDELKGASDRWHITSTDLNPASFPLLRRDSHSQVSALGWRSTAFSSDPVRNASPPQYWRRSIGNAKERRFRKCAPGSTFAYADQDCHREPTIRNSRDAAPTT